jgi:chromosome segregation ATPase
MIICIISLSLSLWCCDQVESAKRQQEEDSDELDSQKRSYVKRIAALNSEIETMTLEASFSRSAGKQSSSSDEDKEKIAQLEQQVQQVTAEKSKLQSELSELENIMMSSNQEWQTRIDELSKEKSDAIRQLKDQSLEEMGEKESAWEKEKLQMKVALADKDRTIADLESERDALSSSSSSSSTGEAEAAHEQQQQLAALREEVLQLESERGAATEAHAALETALQAAAAEKESALAKVEEQDALLRDISSTGSGGDDRQPQELITEFVQDLFGRLHFAFVPPDSSSIDLDEGVLSPNAVLKKCKKVLKQGASEFATVPE